MWTKKEQNKYNPFEQDIIHVAVQGKLFNKDIFDIGRMVLEEDTIPSSKTKCKWTPRLLETDFKIIESMVCTSYFTDNPKNDCKNLNWKELNLINHPILK